LREGNGNKEKEKRKDLRMHMLNSVNSVYSVKQIIN